MRKEDKAIVIEKIGATLKEYAHLYLVDVTGLNAETTSQLRRKCFGTDVKMIVVKNTLLTKVLEKSENEEVKSLISVLAGPTPIMSLRHLTLQLRLLRNSMTQDQRSLF